MKLMRNGHPCNDGDDIASAAADILTDAIDDLVERSIKDAVDEALAEAAERVASLGENFGSVQDAMDAAYEAVRP